LECILLQDSGDILEEDAAFAILKGFSKHAPALSLYTQDDVERSLQSLRTAARGNVVAFEYICGLRA